MSRYTLKKSEHDDGGKFEKLPEGLYTFQITDYKELDKNGADLVSKKGDPMINVTLEVVRPEALAGRKIWHNVIFYRPDSPSIKGIGTTRHFLHCINQPFSGDLEANPMDWIGSQLKATVIHNGDYVNIGEMILDESLHKSPVIPADVAITGNPGGAKTPAEISWEE